MKFTVFFAALAVALAACGQQTQTAEPQAQPYVTPPELEHLEQATLGAGCFWCVEAVFQRLEGVEKVISGYAQGPVLNPTYKQVCSGTTGHAEVARIFFDPEVITFAEILEVFWETHDPTTMNRQGNDVGTQYRSGIYFHNDEQKRVAELSLLAANESGAWSAPIVTEVEAIHNFSCRGLPPELLQRQRQPALLSRGSSAKGGQVHQEVPGQAEGRSQGGN